MKKPKILFWDIETSANISYTWGIWEQNVIKVKKEWEMLSFAHKYMGNKKVECSTQASAGSEKKMLQKLHKVLSGADIIIGHNMDKFDLKKSRTRFLKHNIPALPPIATVDTLKIARNLFAFNSNKLDDLAEFLGVKRKVKHRGFDLWVDCMDGKKSAFRELAVYNKGDIDTLEGVYNKLLEHMKTHPHVALLKGNTKNDCSKCGSTHTQNRGTTVTNTGIKQRVQCQDCAGWFTVPIKKVK